MARASGPSFRRGFKAYAQKLADEIRSELALGVMDRLEPDILARHLEIPLLPLSAIRDQCPDSVDHFCYVETRAFSALTVFNGPARLIVFNDSHAPTRQANSIVHELAHGLLQHAPHAALDDLTGCRIWRDEIELEANYLAGALLVPDRAAVSIVRNRTQLDLAASAFGISRQLLEYRINVTGARTRASRLRS